MAAHKYWQALLMSVPTGDTLELGEFELYNGASRLDSGITPTANIAPTSGTLASLGDGVTTSGPLWSANAGGIVLTWAFSAPVAVDGIRLGARTTIARFPTCVLMRGSDAAATFDRVTPSGVGGIRFVSATLTPVLGLSSASMGRRPIVTQKDYGGDGGRGLITDTVKTKASPSNLPTFCKVRLLRDIDSKVIRETLTDPVTGVYTFDRFDESFTYTVLAIHLLGSFRAVIADRITPGLMP